MENEVHIRSNVTQRYLTHNGSWSLLRDEARKFLTTVDAREWCIQKRLVDVEIFVVHAPHACMTMPVSQCF